MRRALAWGVGQANQILFSLLGPAIPRARAACGEHVVANTSPTAPRTINTSLNSVADQLMHSINRTL